VAVLGAAAGLLLMLSIDWKRPFAEHSYLLDATLLGGGIGAVLGFILTDSRWIQLLRRR